MSMTRHLNAEGSLERPVYHGRIVGLDDDGGQVQGSVPVKFHLGQTGLYGSLVPENQAGLGGLRMNSSALLDAETSVGKAIIRIGERDLVGLRFPFSVLDVLSGTDS